MGRSKIENGNSLLKPEPGLLAAGNGSCLWYSGKGFRHIPNRCFVKVILPRSGPWNVTSSEQGARAKSRARSYARSYCTISVRLGVTILPDESQHKPSAETC
jgi:hypothetical protein